MSHKPSCTNITNKKVHLSTDIRLLTFYVKVNRAKDKFKQSNIIFKFVIFACSYESNTIYLYSGFAKLQKPNGSYFVIFHVFRLPNVQRNFLHF